MAEATAPAFKLGDVVRLKSGGPDMTIVRANDDQSWNCAWFIDLSRAPQVHTHQFPPDALEHKSEPQQGRK